MARLVVGVLSVAVIALFAFLTVLVAVESGPTPVVVAAVVVVLLLGFGVIGALTERR